MLLLLSITQALLCTVFGITGSASMYIVRPVLPHLGLKGSFKEGPWSYRIGSLLLVSPFYTLILLTTGSLAGRHKYFAAMARKMWGRFLPKPVAQKVACTPAKQKAAAAAAQGSVANSSSGQAASTKLPLASAKGAMDAGGSGPT